ncbi:MAG TPA: diguanylate cyclase [Acidimicrobiales bacterium]|nr:diguanylate cyclase [Acidimicrobiales bacterium]
MREETIEMRRRSRALSGLLAGVPPRDELGQRAFEALPTPALLVGPSGRVVAANPSWCRLQPGMAAGDEFATAWAAGGGDPAVPSALRDVAGTAAGIELETTLPDGRRFQAQIVPLAAASLILVVLVDVTAQHEREQRLLYEATHDPLTGAANRALLDRELESALARARRYGHRFGLVYIDLDRFKAINDTYGHQADDHILREVAGRWMGLVRVRDLLARVGGDEFVVLANQCDSDEQLALLAGRLVAMAGAPVHLDLEGDQLVRATAGTFIPDAGTTAAEALAAADHAMYVAKHAGDGA